MQHPAAAQKLVEESPSPVVDAKLRKELGAKVVKALEEIGYTNAGQSSS